jgi:hypothetical protein
MYYAGRTLGMLALEENCVERAYTPPRVLAPGSFSVPAVVSFSSTVVAPKPLVVGKDSFAYDAAGKVIGHAIHSPGVK